MKIKKIQLNKKEEALDQCDYFDADQILKKGEKYARSIGLFFINFSALEYSLDQLIVKSFADDADEIGLAIIKYLRFIDKINYAHAYCNRVVSFVENRRKRLSGEKEVISIFDKLKEISSFRNKLAHANWITLDTDGFIRTRVETDPGTGIVFEKTKITPEIIRKFIRQMEVLSNNIDDLEYK